MTRQDTRNKIRLVFVLFTFENYTGQTDEPTDGRTDTTSYRDAAAHLKTTNERQNVDDNDRMKLKGQELTRLKLERRNRQTF